MSEPDTPEGASSRRGKRQVVLVVTALTALALIALGALVTGVVLTRQFVQERQRGPDPASLPRECRLSEPLRASIGWPVYQKGQITERTDARDVWCTWRPLSGTADDADGARLHLWVVTYTSPQDGRDEARERYDSRSEGYDPFEGIGDASKIHRDDLHGRWILLVRDGSTVVEANMSGMESGERESAIRAVAAEVLTLVK